MLTALVIDDERFAREELLEQLEETGLVMVVGDAGDAISGLKKINQLRPDVVFLDIQMPQVTGIELLSMLDPDTMPYVVLVTAYDQYAIQAFEGNAFDYLLKPVAPLRLKKTLQRLTKLRQEKAIIPNLSHFSVERLTHIPCVGHHRIVLISAQEVEYIYSDLSGVHVQTSNQSATTQLTLKNLEDKTSLLRCHRQYLVHLHHIREIRFLHNGLAEIITTSKHTIPISRRYLKNLKERIGICT